MWSEPHKGGEAVGLGTQEPARPFKAPVKLICNFRNLAYRNYVYLLDVYGTHVSLLLWFV